MTLLEIFINLILACGIIYVCVLSYRKPKTPTEPRRPSVFSFPSNDSSVNKPLPPNTVESPRRETIHTVRYPSITTPARVVEKDNSMLDALPTISITGNKIVDFALTVEMLNQPSQYDNTASPKPPSTESHYPATSTMEHYTPTHHTVTHEPTPSPSPEPTPMYEAPASYSSPDPSPSFSGGDY